MLPPLLRKSIDALLEQEDLQELQDSCARLTARYREGGCSYGMRTATDRLAYLAYRLPATFGVCQEVFAQVPNASIKSFLDIGSGPGTAFWAALEAFPSLSQATLIERDPRLTVLAKKLAKPLEIRPSWENRDISDSPNFGFADLVVCSYVLGELEETAQKNLIQKAWEKTSQFLVLIEPGTPAGFGRLRIAREFLIQKECFFVAPCTHEAPCPLQEKDWCHFSRKIHRDPFHQKIKKAPLSFEDEKYSYLIASKTLHSRSKGRIVRKPLKRPGHVILDLCETTGLERKTFSRRHGALYQKARKASWGEAVDMD